MWVYCRDIWGEGKKFCVFFSVRTQLLEPRFEVWMGGGVCALPRLSEGVPVSKRLLPKGFSLRIESNFDFNDEMITPEGFLGVGPFCVRSEFYECQIGTGVPCDTVARSRRTSGIGKGG